MTRPVVGSGIGRLPIKVQGGRTVGFAEIRQGAATISDAQGKVISTAQRVGEITKIQSRTGKALGYAEHSADGLRINYFEHLAGGTTKPRGYDLINGTRVKHFDSGGRLLGETDLSLGTTGSEVFASLVLVAAVTEEILHDERESERLRKKLELRHHARRV
jgi:hypothetical protein